MLKLLGQTTEEKTGLNFVLLAVPVILSTIIWPLNRRVMMNGGRTDAYGFWVSLSGAIVAGILGRLFGQSYRVPSIWLVGFLVGFAFSVGFCLIINYCLKIGPTGPTVSANNMGLVGPVVVGLLWPVRHTFTMPIIAGLLLVVMAMLGFGLSASAAGAKKQAVTSRWVILVFFGWLLAAMSMTGQYLGSVLAPNQPLTFVSVFFIFAMIILLPFVVRHGRTWFDRNEMVGGIANGSIQAISIFVQLTALQRMGSQIVFPVTVLVPVIAVLTLSALVYKERLHPLTWISCGVGLAGLALLAISR